MKKKLLSLFVSLTMVMSLFSGVGTVFTTTALAADDDTEAAEATEAAEPVDATEVILDQIFVSLEAGESITLKGTVLPVNADDTSITWSSSDESVATVEGGTVTAIGNGYAVITATNEASGLFAECEIKVIFNDVSRGELSSGAYESINWAAENGIIRGFNDGEYFGTEESLTREQFAIMLWRLAGKPGADTSVLSNFQDADQISNSTAKKAIAWAYSEGLVKGFSDGTFGPKNELTRAQMAIVLWRMQGKQSAASAGFSDVTSTTTGVSAINWASAKGIVKGYSDGTYRPENDITRAEFTVMLYRYDNKFGEDTEEIAADNAVEKVSAIGYVAADGAKVSAVVVEYSEALFKAEVSTDTYDVWSYLQDSAGSCELGGDPAAVTAVYVNDKAETDEDPTGFGRYVIIELNTDFQLNQSVTYNYVMAADVTQTEDITAGRTTILSSGTAFTNYTANSYEQTGRDGTVSIVTEKIANSSEYFIEDIGRYDIGIIHTTNAFEEATGEYVDLDLDYAIYVPEDYDPEQEYMMMLHIEDAGNLGNDARLVLTEAQTPVNMISDEIQQYAKDQGYGGIIIVCPQITEDYRSTRDNYTFSAAVYATWDLVDMVIEEYNIDTDRIYGSGQSMGGMQVLEMAVQRDNFFAGILATGCQWGQNYNQEVEYSGNAYYTAPADGEYIWTVDSDGNPCDYKNFYYLISDDNVLCSNCVGDSFSTSVWTELAFLYEDLAGAEIPKATWNPLTTSVEDQNAMLEKLVATESDLGIYWNAFEGGNHMATWVYADRVDSMYYWLLDQTRESEMERDKLDLDGDFELADEQITTADRLIYEDAENPENNVYYVTGKAGAGTAGYNSGQYSPRGGAPDKNPGWTVETEEEETVTLSVGAGNGEIVFDQAMFPLEGFDGSVDTNPYSRVLIMEDSGSESVAIVSMELVNVPDAIISAVKEEINEKTGIPEENIWVHANHTVTTPHAPSGDAYEYYEEAVLKATSEAIDEAVASLQPAKMSIDTTTLDINVNRDIQLEDGWYIGSNPEMYSNKTMTIIRFDDLEGNPVAIYMNYGIKPTTIDNTEMDAGTRKISSDLTGMACVALEEKYGCPAMFVMPATGDQQAAQTTTYYEWDEESNSAVKVELSVEEGIELYKGYGEEMIAAAVELLDSMDTYLEDTTIRTGKTSYSYLNKDETSEVSIDVSAITIGDTIAMVGLKPELNAITELQLAEASPYEYTLVTGFLDGDQKYMPDESAYDLQTWEYSRTGFAKGCAEKFVEVSVELLTSIKDGTYVSDTSQDEGEGKEDVEYEIITVGGINWYVIDDANGAQLLLSVNTVGSMAYNATNGTSVWSESDVRTYLNGSFLTSTFSEAEQERIVSTELTNESNPTYGIGGGDNTTDKIFILSASEVSEYLVGTDYIAATDAEGNAVWYHVRTPGEAVDVQSCVTANGTLDLHGPDGGVRTEGGVRAAMWYRKY